MLNCDNNRSAGLNSIPLKALRLAKEPIAEHLCNTYYLFFTKVIFSSILKNTFYTCLQKGLKT